MQQTAAVLYGFSAPLLNGQVESLDAYRGRVLLIVNTASKCGFTPQYKGLESLRQTYRERGFEVLGFPCNQFGGQEPGSAPEIAAFCQQNFAVSFPIFAKVDVNGPSAHPLFQFLKQARPGLLGFLGASRIRWNFTKFLVDRQGSVVARFAPSTTPASLKGQIERLLDSPFRSP